MLYSIQYLRGIAALLVVALHAFYKESQYIGGLNKDIIFANIGVDIFFIISGYVMAHTYKEKTNILDFFKRRCFRILPLYWMTSFLSIVVFMIMPQLSKSELTISSIIHSLFLIPSENKFLNPNGWTLTYEFVFYFVYAIPFMLTNKRVVHNILAASMLIILVLLGFAITSDNNTIRFLFDSLLIEFVFGVGLYHMTKFSVHRHDFKLLLVCSFLLISLSLLSYLSLSGNYRFISFGIPAFLICTSFSMLEPLFNHKPSRFFVELGNSSYSLYLTHVFVLAGMSTLLSKFMTKDQGLAFILILIICSLIVARYSYLYIELTIMKYFKKVF